MSSQNKIEVGSMQKAVGNLGPYFLFNVLVELIANCQLAAEPEILVRISYDFILRVGQEF